MREFFAELVAAKDRIEDDYARGVTLAWIAASLQRVKKLPPLQTLLKTAQKRQSVSEQRGMLEILSAQYGGALRPHRKTTR